MRALIVCLCFLFSNLALSQSILPIQYDTNQVNHEFILNGLADFGASSIQNQFSSKFAFGGYITNDMKDQSFNLHNGVNRFGGELSASLEYRNMKANFLKSEKWGYLIKAESSSTLSSIYSKDLFGLIFYGNERYLAESISFSGSRFSTFAFEKIGFGIIEKSSKTNASLNFYSISNYSSAYIKDGELFQSADGDSVSLRIEGAMESATSSDYLKGFGIGIDLDFRIPVQLIEEKTSFFQFQIKNVGLAYLNTPVTRYAMDTTLTFDGFTFDDIVDSDSILSNDFSILSKLGIDSSVVNRTRFLPGFIQFGKIVDNLSTSKFQTYYGIKMFTINTYSPLLYFGGQYKTTEWMDLSLNISYGGFAKFKTGFYSQLKFSKVNIGLGSEDLIGLISKKGRGASLNLRVRCIL